MKLLICSNVNEFAREITLFNKEDIFYTSISNFQDGEMEVKIEEYKKLKNEDILIIQSTTNSNNLIEVLFAIDILNRIGVKSIKILFTYLIYSRQDRIDSLDKSLSFKVIMDMFLNKNISKIYVINLHSPQTINAFSIPSINIEVYDFIMEMIQNKYKNPLLISPDVGNSKTIINLSQKTGIEYNIALKYRPKANENKILSFVGSDIVNKDCIIIDDIVDTAGTLCNVAELLAKKGANSIDAYITHGVLSPKSIDRINNSYFKKIYISNTINTKEKLEKINKKVEIFSLTNWILNKIQNEF